jgi:hypothetical protein
VEETPREIILAGDDMEYSATDGEEEEGEDYLSDDSSDRIGIEVLTVA